MTNPLGGFCREINNIIRTTPKQGEELSKTILENKINVGLDYELHYTRQLLMKILTHLIGESYSYCVSDDMPPNENKKRTNIDLDMPWDKILKTYVKIVKQNRIKSID